MIEKEFSIYKAGAREGQSVWLSWTGVGPRQWFLLRNIPKVPRGEVTSVDFQTNVPLSLRIESYLRHQQRCLLRNQVSLSQRSLSHFRKTEFLLQVSQLSHVSKHFCTSGISLHRRQLFVQFSFNWFCNGGQVGERILRNFMMQRIHRNFLANYVGRQVPSDFWF